MPCRDAILLSLSQWLFHWVATAGVACLAMTIFYRHYCKELVAEFMKYKLAIPPLAVTMKNE